MTAREPPEEGVCEAESQKTETDSDDSIYGEEDIEELTANENVTLDTSAYAPASSQRPSSAAEFSSTAWG